MTVRLRALDLFSGTGSITKAFRNSGHDCDSLDMDPRFAPTFCTNVLTWDYTALPRGHYDAIWASCPCEQYSIARSNARAPRDLALADALVQRTLEIIDWFHPKAWFLENPAGSLLWRRFQFPRVVQTSYCSYNNFPYRTRAQRPTFGTSYCATRVAEQVSAPRCVVRGIWPTPRKAAEA
jgi:site-specific DNA-cytosine methylase